MEISFEENYFHESVPISYKIKVSNRKKSSAKKKQL